VIKYKYHNNEHKLQPQQIHERVGGFETKQKKVVSDNERINLTQISKRPGANRSGIRANKIKE
jgi:hypothetical protein